MAKYLVPVEMLPGVQRSGVGFFKPGDTLELPDAASQPSDHPSLRLIPLDKDAHDALELAAEALIEREEVRLSELEKPRKLTEREKKDIRARVKPIPADFAAAQRAAAGLPEKKSDQMTMRQFAEGKGPMQPPAQGGGSKRAADR